MYRSNRHFQPKFFFKIGNKKHAKNIVFCAYSIANYVGTTIDFATSALKHLITDIRSKRLK